MVLGIIRYYKALHGIRNYKVFQGITRYYMVLQGIIRYYRGL